MAGNNKTSWIFILSVSSIVNLSIPSPHPAVGGNPYSNDFTNPSSISYASSSPLFLSFIYWENKSF